MAARPVWKGQLRLSLVSIPVELYSARKTASKISFRSARLDNSALLPRSSARLDNTLLGKPGHAIGGQAKRLQFFLVLLGITSAVLVLQALRCPPSVRRLLRP